MCGLQECKMLRSTAIHIFILFLSPLGYRSSELDKHPSEVWTARWRDAGHQDGHGSGAKHRRNPLHGGEPVRGEGMLMHFRRLSNRPVSLINIRTHPVDVISISCSRQGDMSRAKQFYESTLGLQQSFSPARERLRAIQCEELFGQQQSHGGPMKKNTSKNGAVDSTWCIMFWLIWPQPPLVRMDSFPCFVRFCLQNRRDYCTSSLAVTRNFHGFGIIRMQD